MLCKHCDCGYIYVVKDCNGKYKIGRTGDIIKRLQGYKTENSGPVELVLYEMVYNNKISERVLHSCFKKNRIHGEWFDFTDEEFERVKELFKHLKDGR